MSDEPVMQTEVTYYQRLLASDYDEAAEIVENYLEGDHAPEQVYDQILLPALYQARVDYRRGKLTAEDEHFVQRATNDLVEEIDVEQIKQHNGDQEDGDGKRSPEIDVWGCAARDDNDELALRMLQRLLNVEHCEMKIVARPSELKIDGITPRSKPLVICIGSVAPTKMAQTRHLTKRLRSRAPNAKIVVGRWGVANEFRELEEQRKLLLEAGADHVAATLMEARSIIMQIGEKPRVADGSSQRKAADVKGAASKS